MELNIFNGWKLKILEGDLCVRLRPSNTKYFIISIESPEKAFQDVPDSVLIMAYSFTDKKVVVFYRGFIKNLETPELAYFTPTPEERLQVLQFIP